MRSIAPEPRAFTRLERFARWTPLFILIYFALQLALRLWLSPWLEVDDAEMVGQIAWAWGYSNSHPPLFHWIVRLCYDAFGSWTAATAVPRFALLAAGYLLVYDAARRAARSNVTATLALGALFFIPVVAVKTQGRLTHSILGFAATAAVMHATVLVLRSGTLSTFVWLGLAVAAGLLAKYNFLLVVAALVIAIALRPKARRAFVRPAGLVAVALPLLLFGPHLVWVGRNAELAAKRISMLKTGGGPFGLNLPANSVFDGLVSLALVALISILPVLLAFWLAARLEKGGGEGETSEVERLLGLVCLAELAGFAALVMAAGFTQVHERYLLVLLPPFAIWAALRFRLRNRGAVSLCLCVIVIAIGITIVRPLSALRGHSRLAYPYEAFARDAADMTLSSGPFAVLADRPENSGNLVAAMPRTSIFNERQQMSEVLVVADTSELLDRITIPLRPQYSPATEVRLWEHPMRWRPERKARLVMQLWRRSD